MDVPVRRHASGPIAFHSYEVEAVLADEVLAELPTDVVELLRTVRGFAQHHHLLVFEAVNQRSELQWMNERYSMFGHVLHLLCGVRHDWVLEVVEDAVEDLAVAEAGDLHRRGVREGQQRRGSELVQE